VVSMVRSRDCSVLCHARVALLAGTILAIDTSVEEFQARARTLAAALPPDKQDKFQLGPVSKPDGAAVWASVFRDPKYGNSVFLFVAKP